jgi:hypothetical protein
VCVCVYVYACAHAWAEGEVSTVWSNECCRETAVHMALDQQYGTGMWLHTTLDDSEQNHSRRSRGGTSLLSLHET